MNREIYRAITALVLAALTLSASLQASFHKVLEEIHSGHEHTYFSGCPGSASFHEHHPHTDCDLCHFLNGKQPVLATGQQSSKSFIPEARPLTSYAAELPLSARLSNLVPRAPPFVEMS